MRDSDTMIARRAGLLAITVGAGLLLVRWTAPAAPVQRGASAIARYGCGSCHVIRGIDGAHGRVGPPLDTLPARMYIAGVLPNNRANFTRWVQDPKGVDEKTAMPKLGVTAAEPEDMAAYIYSNK